MLPEPVRKWLHDIIDCGNAIQQHCAARSFEDYLRDRTLRAAVEREFITIGEALRRAVREAPEVAAAIPESQDIIDFRNLLVHGYAAVNPKAVWSIVEEELPHLLSRVRILAGSAPA